MDYIIYIDKYIWTIYWYVYTYIDMYLYIYCTLIRIISSFFIIIYLSLCSYSFHLFPCTWIISDFESLSFQLTKLEQASWWVQRWVLHSKQSIFRSMASALMVTTARASCCWWFLDDCWLFECRRENVGFCTEVCISNLLVTSRFFNVKGRGADCWLCLKVIFQSFYLCMTFLGFNICRSILFHLLSTFFWNLWRCGKAQHEGLDRTLDGQETLKRGDGWDVVGLVGVPSSSEIPAFSISWVITIAVMIMIVVMLCLFSSTVYHDHFRHDSDMIWYDLIMMEKMMRLMIYVSCNFMYVSYVYVIYVDMYNMQYIYILSMQSTLYSDKPLQLQWWRWRWYQYMQKKMIMKRQMTFTTMLVMT